MNSRRHPSARAGDRVDRAQFVAQPLPVLALGAAFVATFAIIALLVPQQPLAIEQHWNEWMLDIQGSFLTHVANLFNAFGRGITRAALIAVPGIVLLVAKRWWALLAFAITEAATPLISSLTKALVDRSRPANGLVHPAGASFPSGHAAFAAATSIAFVLLFTHVGPRRRFWWTLAALAIVTMSWSRTYLQVHWLLDVIAGSLLGAGIALTIFAALQNWSSTGRAAPVRVRRDAKPAQRSGDGRVPTPSSSKETAFDTRLPLVGRVPRQKAS